MSGRPRKIKLARKTRAYTPKRILQERAIQIAVELRAKGETYYAIGKKLNISHVTAWKYVKLAMERARTETAEDTEQLRDLEAARLDGLVQKLWERRADPRVADTIIRTMDRRSKLLGLDSPTKTDVNVTGLEKKTDEELLKLAEEVAQRARKEATHPDDPGDEEEA